MRFRLAALLFTGVLSFAQARPAIAASSMQIPESTLKQTLARLLGVTEAQILSAKGITLEQPGDVHSIVFGRYYERENRTSWTFPVLGVMHPCADQLCMSILRLGQAANRLVPIAIVDLEQPLATVGSLAPSWVVPQLREPAQKPRHPVLLLVSDYQLQPKGEPARPASDGEQQTEHALYLISLRNPKEPKLLHTLTLLERYPEPERSSAPPSNVGRRIEGLRLGRLGSDIVMQVIERAIDSQYSHCLRPEPSERQFRLVEDRFVEQPSSKKAPRDCR